MLHPLGPRQIGNVNQPVNALFDFDESAEIGELSYAAFDNGADGVTVSNGGPWIGLELLNAQRNAPVAWFHFEDHGLNLVADLDHLAGMLHAAAPGHFRNVN